MAESRRGLMMFRPFFQRLRKGFSSSAYSASPVLNHSKFDEDMSVGKAVPADVKEGFFNCLCSEGRRNTELGKNMDSIRKGFLLSLVDLKNCKRFYDTAKEAMLALKVGDICKANILESN
ncbi:hypothetical protein Godav_015886 [Gossypium davidsonii]|uniref:Uncharacterized protein n=2 Tax=Gossypium TaxID=3633 RepID=A0A7J8RPM8_GOSDV|nr:hypothetical protein [Gossypium davidsonii]MBA0651009.1 hypothetical protein [Gossypium klotzschianum]